jgi:beta-glucosidase
VSQPGLGAGESIKIRATISNTGEVFGEEVVQLYVRDVAASVSRPIRELKGFRKIGLEPGSSDEVTFTLNPDDLFYFGADRQWGIDPGTIKVWIGPNAMEGLESSFEIQ